MATKLLLSSRALRGRAVARLVSHSAAVSVRPSSLTELSNGVRVVTEDLGASGVATIDVCVDCGSRAETESTAGLAALVGHSLLRQTDERALQAMGAQMWARVGRERTHLTLRLAANDVTKGIQMLAKTITSPDFADLDGAREQAWRQLAAADRNPETVVMNGAHAMAFQNTSLALATEGRSESLSALTRDACQNWTNAHVKGPRVVVAVAGDVDHDECVRSVDQWMAKLTPVYDKTEVPEVTRARFTGSDVRVRDDAMPLAHIVIAVEGASRDSPDALALELAKELFGRWDRTYGGGADCSSYLGLCSSVDALTHGFRAFNTSYADTGLFGAYFVCERLKQEDLLWHATYEWKRFCHEITDNELNRAKNALLTRWMRRAEESRHVAPTLADHVLTWGRPVGVAEWKARVLGMDARRVRDVCSEHLWDRCPVVSALGPIEQLEDYEVLRSKFYWFRV